MIELTQAYVTNQAEVKLLELATQVAQERGVTKSQDKIEQATKCRLWLKALSYSSYIDKDTIDKLVYCLADICEANSFPYAPVITGNSQPSLYNNVTGSVISVDVSGGSTGLSTSGGPVTASGTITLGGTLNLASGGTGVALSDPGANKLWGWDDTDNSIGFWTIGSGLSYDHATHTLSASGSGITNSAAANELMKSNGTNAVASGLFIPSTSNVNLGSLSLAGTQRTISALSSSPNCAIAVNAQSATAQLYSGDGSIFQALGSAGGTIASVVNNSSSITNTLSRSDNTRNGVMPAAKVSHQVNGGAGVPLTGVGVSIVFETNTDNVTPVNVIGSSISSISTSISAGSESFDIALNTMRSGAISEVARFSNLAGPTTRVVMQGTSMDVTSTSFSFNADSYVSTNLKVGKTLDTVIDRRLHVEENSSGNSMLYPVRLTAFNNSGVGGVNLGAGIEFEVESGGGNLRVGSTIESVLTTATNGAENFDLIFKTMAAGAAANENFRVGSNKLSFFGVTTVARATTAGTASTFAANTSGIANDTATWDGYTIGQIVKALRNYGLLT